MQPVANQRSSGNEYSEMERDETTIARQFNLFDTDDEENLIVDTASDVDGLPVENLGFFLGVNFR